MRAPCHQGEGSLHLAQADDPLAKCGIAHSTRMSHIQNSAPPTFHPDVSHPEFCSADIPSGCLTSEILLRRHSIRIFRIRRLTPDGRGGRFNFPSQTYPDPLIGYFTSGCLTAGWERRAFQLPRSDMSGSSDSAYPESIHDRQFRFPGQLGSSDTRDSSNPFPPTIKKQTLIILMTKSPFCTVQWNFS